MALFTGTSVANHIIGTAAADTIRGYGSNDMLEGRGGNDRIYGGGGNDKLIGGTGNDTLSGGAGNDIFQFAAGDAQDIITDLGAGDVIKISGYTSAQSLVQDETSVILTLSSSDKITFLNSSVESVQAALPFGVPDGGGGSTGGAITGTRGKDTLNGTSGNDVIYGLGGDDTLSGGGGNDRIHGGAGWDIMTGGSGNDTFVFTSGSESPLMTTIYSDFITDWTAGDRIDLSGIDANELISGNQAFEFGGYSFGHPPTVTTPGTFTIAGFGGELYILGYTDNIAGPDFQIAIWSASGESGLTSDHIIF
jgi:Ca2+-binding RTX toxin-like protein